LISKEEFCKELTSLNLYCIVDNDKNPINYIFVDKSPFDDFENNEYMFSFVTFDSNGNQNSLKVSKLQFPEGIIDLNLIDNLEITCDPESEQEFLTKITKNLCKATIHKINRQK
jgi:hypothetical protein